MNIRIADIPVEGRNIEFEIEAVRLSALAGEAERRAKGSAFIAPHYQFSGVPKVNLRLELEGSTVLANGVAEVRFSTSCSRCAEEASREMSVPIQLILKPISERAQTGEQDADLSIGFYTGEELNCAELVQDFVMLALPYSVLCSEECKGLCAQCGQNLNERKCTCEAGAEPEGPFAVLKQLLLH